MVASILNTICDQRHKDVAAAKEKVRLRMWILCAWILTLMQIVVSFER
jgi:hypothetical protein